MPETTPVWIRTPMVESTNMQIRQILNSRLSVHM